MLLHLLWTIVRPQHTPPQHVPTKPHDVASGMSLGEVDHHAWVQSALGPSLRAAVAHWPWTFALEDGSGGVRVALLHYPLDAEGRDFASFVAEPSAAALDPIFISYQADLVFYGHNHAASDVQGRARYVNPGSLGCDTAPRYPGSRRHPRFHAVRWQARYAQRDGDRARCCAPVSRT